MKANPFNITKAVTFSDQGIQDYWVDMPKHGLLNLVKPCSAMPMIVLGGKGSGKTHLLRYLSYPVQKIRHAGDGAKGVLAEEFLGIYVRCSGLNAVRFSGKGQSEDVWAGLFAYYIELWLSQVMVTIALDVMKSMPAAACPTNDVANGIDALFDVQVAKSNSLDDVLARLVLRQKTVDIAVNNCAISRKLDVQIETSPGKLVFGIPKVLQSHCPVFSKVNFVYLIDEFENLTETQQQHVNTLLRENEAPTSFKIGSRLYGVKTYKTYSAGETNKEGSEYEILPLDGILRKQEAAYRTFACAVVRRRLHEAGYVFHDHSQRPIKQLAGFFQPASTDRYADDELAFMRRNYSDTERPHLLTLRDKLQKGFEAGIAPGVRSQHDVALVVERIRVPEHALLEKLNILLLYQDWYKMKDLLLSASEIASGTVALQSKHRAPRHRETLLHYKADLLAQLFRECSQPQRYFGFDSFVDMSQGSPRNLLIILKHVFTWAMFNGESPFTETMITAKSQVAGIEEASEVFYRDAQMPGPDGPIVQASMNRLGQLFRGIRFADKPSECSLCTFSANLSECSPDTRRIVDLAENWSWLISVDKGQKDRNTMRIDMKYQINSMLAPRWDLPIYRRGAVGLSAVEMNAIFDPSCSPQFDDIVSTRVGRSMAPFFGRTPKELVHPSLPGFPS